MQPSPVLAHLETDGPQLPTSFAAISADGYRSNISPVSLSIFKIGLLQ